MRGRYEIRETTKYADSVAGWHEVTITDLVTGEISQARATTYAEAERKAWYNLKALQQISASRIDLGDAHGKAIRPSSREE